jgi:GT2 family glycosyltransferase/2-polyprenyl-3-methyl-5-hydroxy-6-metoxy-1,4-benzoquinol methylase
LTELTPRDLCVVIPTRGRPDVLARTLDALTDQTVSGHEIVVVLDGTDESEPRVPPTVRTVAQSHGGPGVARNTGVAATDRPLVLFLGADMIPTSALVEHHLAAHAAEPDRHVAVLGRVAWHPEVARNPINRWLDWSRTQFDYDALDRQHAAGERDAGFGRFYSCNLSLTRSLFVESGGFDPDFVLFYEDLDLGWRLGELGMVLRYEPAALVHHHHAYDWPGLEARFRGIGVGERMMARKHAWFEPWFRDRVAPAMDGPPIWSGWARLADRLPAATPVVRTRAERWYWQRLADPFLEAWEGERDRDELRRYLGADYDERRLQRHVAGLEEEEAAAPDERTFYKTSRAYLYDLTVFAMSGTKAPYRRLVREVAAPGARLLDYGCGIGADGLRLLEQGYRVEFADYDNPSVEFLRWRLQQRGIDRPVHDIEQNIPGGFDVAYCFDVLEHVDDPVDVLERLESLAEIVVVNFLEPAPHNPHDSQLHRPLPITELVDRSAEHGLLHYSVHYGRSHLVAYRSQPAAGAIRRVRSRAWRAAGAHSREANALRRVEHLAARVRARA